MLPQISFARSAIPNTVRLSLTAAELVELAALLRRAFDCIAKLKAKNPAAAPIQYPKLPSVFSESVILHCSSVLFPGARNLRRGGVSADILFESGKRTKRVEIKATGQQAFQYFGQKDISADFLVWLAFGECFLSQVESPIRIYVLPKPGRVFLNPMKITLATFRQRAAGMLICYEARLREIIDGKVERLP